MKTDSIILRTGDFLVREGEQSDAMYLLKKGSLAVIKRSGDHEGQIGTIYAGELVGEMSFLDRSPRSASVKAMVECEVVEIPHDKFTQFLNKQPKWFHTLINTLLERLRKANTRIKV
jgi:CRP-like cAMP-binding protein